MGFASLVCTYLYGTFAVIKTALETFTKLAKNLIKKIDTLASTLMTTVTYTINATMRTIVNLVKQYEKELFDLLYNSVFGTDKSFWCNRLWKCAALLAELLDSNSWLNNLIKRWFEKKCKNTGAFDLMDLIKQSVTDFLAFQQTVCAAGFTIEFGISYIKRLLEWCASVIDGFNKFLERNIRRLKILAEQYLNTIIDWGVLDYLDKLISFFTCAFDDSYSCSEIATASNLYQDVMSKLKLAKNGDGYDLSSEYKNAIYGGLEGAKNQCSNLKQEIDATYAKCIDPSKLKTANAAYNLSANIFPGGMSISDIREGNWKNNHIVKKWNLTKESYMNAWRKLNGDSDDKTFKELVDGTFIDEDGNVYVKNGCTYVLLDDGLTDADRYTGDTWQPDWSLSSPPNNSAMVFNDEIVSVNEAAIRIYQNDENDAEAIKECKTLYEFINDWKRNPDGAVRYNEQVI